MADLDDFFAKKDKKKKEKPKAKFITPEELAKNLEDSAKREAAATKARKQADSVVAEPQAAVGGSDGGDEGTLKDGQPEVGGTIPSVPSALNPPVTTPITLPEPVEEEWKEVIEEDQRKDYTGLKIGQMTLNDEEEANDSDEEDGDSDSYPSNIDVGSGGGRHGGPWKKLIPAEEVTQIPMEVEKPTSKAYVSPALRHNQQLLAPISARAKPNKRIAPDITNADYFPTLGAARPEEQRKKKNEPAFEEVRHGGRVQRVKDAAPTTNSNAAVNRFQTLDDDDS